MKRVVIIVAVPLVIAATVIGSLGWLRARRAAQLEQRLKALKLQCDTFEDHAPCFADWSSACDDGIGFACRRAAFTGKAFPGNAPRESRIHRCDRREGRSRAAEQGPTALPPGLVGDDDPGEHRSIEVCT